MESWEVLKAAVETVGVKAVAARLRVSAALVYKWCQPAKTQDADASGAHNPLDRLRVIHELTRDPEVINWLCQAAGGFFVPNPHREPVPKAEELLGITQQVVEDFGGLLADISQSIENDGIITRAEADRIRAAWEQLKRHSESFVVACERGLFARRQLNELREPQRREERREDMDEACPHGARPSRLSLSSSLLRDRCALCVSAVF